MEQTSKANKSKKKIILIIIGIIVLVGLAVGMWFLSRSFKDEPVEGGKNITLRIASERDSYDFEEKYETKEEYLGDFLDKEGIIGFDTSEYGRFITSVNGYEASSDDQSWWCVMVNGESAVTGVDEIVIEDGAEYSLELKIGW
ncbi:MAG: DUF4430 domain-containing protein [Ruminococcus sp.]|nr:DUF4430 domain-containing protein [Ruminococcus sp.]